MRESSSDVPLTTSPDSSKPTLQQNHERASSPAMIIHSEAQPETKDTAVPTVEAPLATADDEHAEPSDIWSSAYREAVDHLGQDINKAILEADNVASLFAQLDKMGKDASQESLFLKGVKYLKSIQVPLERFKLALDLAAPLTSIEPTTAAVFGVVRGATVVSIFALLMLINTCLVQY